MAELGRKFVLQGGTQHNLAALKAQVDYIKDRVPGAEVYVHPHTGEAGAIGAAMEALRLVKRKGYSTFIGIDNGINVQFTSRNDESTRCHFCPNDCARTFIDTLTPDGKTSRYISGFSCEKGTVESEEAMIELSKQRKKLMKEFPNLVDYESKKLFAHFYDPAPMPDAETTVHDVSVEKTLFFGVKKTPIKRKFQRSPEEKWEQRQRVRVGIPRVLNIWTIAPFLRTYLESLGIQKHHVVFSDYTSEEMWVEGGKYGSIDPCYPSKVAQAHIHNLLFHHHSDEKKLDFIFFPCVTHVPPGLNKVMDTASCPIVAGAPEVMKAAFTKETDFFATRGIKYLNPATTFTEPTLLKRQLFDAFGPALGVTEDESDFAVEQGWKAIDKIDEDLQARGKAILETVEEENRVAILMLSRPYHSDPGLNHSVLEEFQVLGYPVLSMRSLPKDPKWLHRFFEEDIKKGLIETPLEVTDVWPENYSANSVQKVWSAKFAARHPNVVVLDLSSFKCGHDAPTYGLIDSVIAASATPYSALHDIDANKPGGSIKIRVKTYAHSLKLHEERLEDVARKTEELRNRLDEKRLALLELKAHQLDTVRQRDPGLEAEIETLRKRVQALAERDAGRAAVVDQDPKLVKLGVKRKDSDQIARISTAQ